MQVIIPIGATVGSTFQVSQPNGQLIVVAVPPGGMPGMAMNVPIQQVQMQVPVAQAIPMMQQQQQQYPKTQVLPIQQQQMMMGGGGAAVIPVGGYANSNNYNVPFPNGSTLIEKYGGAPFSNCNPLYCLCGLCCYPCAVGKVAGFATAGPGKPPDQGTCCMYCVGVICIAQFCGPIEAIVGCSARGHLENKFEREAHRGQGMSNGPMDCCCHCCCPCFIVAQELQAIDNYEKASMNNMTPRQHDMTRTDAMHSASAMQTVAF
jgi:Cys-rich protein (TIGR01571 family)